MTNRHRGEVTFELGSERHVLRLTLGALAEIEAAFGVEDLQALGERLARGRIGARDVTVLLGAALRGGGAEVSDKAVAGMIGASELTRAIAAISDLFELSFGWHGEPMTEKAPAKSRPRKPQMR